MTVFRRFLLNLCNVMINFSYLCTMTRRVTIRSILALLQFLYTMHEEMIINSIAAGLIDPKALQNF